MGTVVSAIIGGTVVKSQTVAAKGDIGAGQIPAGDGTEVSFTLDSLTANETITWKKGNCGEIALNASATGGAAAADAEQGATGRSGAPGKDGADGAAGPAGPRGVRRGRAHGRLVGRLRNHFVIAGVYLFSCHDIFFHSKISPFQ